jgi:sulfate/thiosulfate transport system substrate-binding protein
VAARQTLRGVAVKAIYGWVPRRFPRTERQSFSQVPIVQEESNSMIGTLRTLTLTTALALSVLAGCGKKQDQGAPSAASASAELKPQQSIDLLNVSYDPTREFYTDLNHLFTGYWQREHQQRVNVKQSHGGSGKQARAVIDGLEADVVTLALAYDIDAIQERAGLLPKDWQTLLPHKSTPYTSTIAFLVRKGNPKQIKDWDDLLKPGVEVITPNPKTSGGARWNYLAAWGFALKKNDNDEAKARDFVGKLFKHVPVLDSGARGATTTFVERKIGDVLLAWENEALLSVSKLGATDLEVVIPSWSILAEPPVALVSKYAQKHNTEAVAKGYLEFLYSPEAQKLAAKHFYRPWDEAALKEAGDKFPKIQLFTIDDLFGGWQVAQKKHFDDGGEFDKLYQPAKK